MILHSYDVQALLKSGVGEDELIRLIQKTPAQWEDLDPGGRIDLLQGVLTVRQSWRVHRHIAALLQAVSSCPRASHRYAIEHSRHSGFLSQLQTRVTVDFVETPLSDSVGFLNNAAKVQIHVDRLALENDGVPFDEPVTLSLADVPLSKVVELSLNDSCRLTMTVMNGRLTLTTVDVDRKNIHPVVYDVSDITDSEEDVYGLSSTIKSTTDPWDFWPGHAPSLTAMPRAGKLVVYQTEVVHQEIRELLAFHRSVRVRHKNDEKPGALRTSTRLYRLDRDTATDLVTLIPELIEPDSWRNDTNRDGGLIRMVAAGRRIEFVVVNPDRNTNSGQTQASQPDALFIPQAVLVIRHAPQVHSQVAELLQTLRTALPVHSASNGARVVRGPDSDAESHANSR